MQQHDTSGFEINLKELQEYLNKKRKVLKKLIEQIRAIYDDGKTAVVYISRKQIVFNSF